MSDTINDIKNICILQEQNKISEQWALHQIGKIMKQEDAIKDEIEQLKHDNGLVEHSISKKVLKGAITQREQMLDSIVKMPV